MSKIGIVESYIESCTKKHTMDSAKKLVNDILGVFSNDIDGLTSNLDLYDYSHMYGSTTVDYIGDVSLLKRKLEFYKASLIETEKKIDPLWEFKQLFEQDLRNLCSAKSDYNNSETPEVAKQQLYKEITAKYHSIIPNLGSGLYQYFAEQGFYDEVSGDSLSHNLDQIYHKLIAFKTIGFPGVIKETTTPLQQLIISNNSTANANATVTISISNTIELINQLPPEVLSDKEKEELEEKLSAIEVAKTSGNKEKLAGKVGNVLKYIADKGIEVGIAALPYLGEISKFIQSM
jgi:hypothetical protein